MCRVILLRYGRQNVRRSSDNSATIHYKGEPGKLFSQYKTKKQKSYNKKRLLSVGPFSGYNKKFQTYFTEPEPFKEPTIKEINSLILKNCRGRPAIIRTGKRGRPSIAKLVYEGSTKKLKKYYEYNDQ